MKKTLFLKQVCIGLFAVVFMISFAACAAPTPASEPTPEPTATAQSVVVFADPLLEKMVREAIGKPEGDITLDDAKAITELKLNIEWQQFIPEETQIHDITGLEAFSNLETLELSFHNIKDISPLAGLTKLTSLSLGGNPVQDISPLAGLTNLRGLTLFNCAASDYSPLSKLTNLDFLMLDYSSIADLSALSNLTKLTNLTLKHTQIKDVSPLAGLTNLRRLSLAECAIDDYSPLAGIYVKLDEADFSMASSLSDLGFQLNLDDMLAIYTKDATVFTVNHSEWGTPPMELEADSVRMTMALDNGYYLTVGRHPLVDAYVFSVRNGDDTLTNYVYNVGKKEFSIANDDRAAAESAVRAALGDVNAEDILLAPISIFDEQVKQVFSMRADQLFQMPFEERSLVNLGFVPDQKNGWCEYTQNEGNLVRVRINRPEWGGNPGWDIEYYTEVNGNPITVWYTVNDRRFYCTATLIEDGSKGDFEYFPKENRHQDGMIPEKMSVLELLQKVYKNATLDDPYVYIIKSVQQYFEDQFRVNENDLYALPVGQ
ncbi:MAG TPA: leucine-rich repeat domain-containing protein [Clostridia bacterium]|nr:leucine-rich repeat domain-containing protein [Clostridia bacterium]